MPPSIGGPTQLLIIPQTRSTRTPKPDSSVTDAASGTAKCPATRFPGSTSSIAQGVGCAGISEAFTSPAITVATTSPLTRTTSGTVEPFDTISESGGAEPGGGFALDDVGVGISGTDDGVGRVSVPVGSEDDAGCVVVREGVGATAVPQEVMNTEANTKAQIVRLRTALLGVRIPKGSYKLASLITHDNTGDIRHKLSVAGVRWRFATIEQNDPCRGICTFGARRR